MDTSATTRRRVAFIIVLLLLVVVGGLAARQIGATSRPAALTVVRASWAGLAAPISTTLPSPIATGTAPLPTPVGTLPPPVTTSTPAPSATLVPAPTPGTPGARRPDRVTLCVSLRQDPDGAVPPGGVFSYTLTLANSGAPGPVSVRIALDPNIEVLDFTSLDGHSFVDYRGDDAVSVVFGGLDAGLTGQARIMARVRPGTAPGSRIVSRATASWGDGTNHARSLSNSVTITVGPQADTGHHGLRQALQVAPDGPIPAGTLVVLGGSFFGQDEPVSLWVNLPDGQVTALDPASERADATGTLVVGLNTSGAAPGLYSLVAHGVCTGMEGVGVFTIR
jgi:hypothetical protein